MFFRVDEILRAMAALARVSAMVMVIFAVPNFAEPIPTNAPSILYFPGFLTKSGRPSLGLALPPPDEEEEAQLERAEKAAKTIKIPKNFFIDILLIAVCPPQTSAS
jgi:hypothetical protein